MFKLYKDGKTLKNISLNIDTKNIVNTAKISLFTTTFALALITINNRKVHEINDINICTGSAPVVSEKNSLTYKDYIFNEYINKTIKYSHLLCIDEDICKKEVIKKIENVSEFDLKNDFSILNNKKYSDFIDVQVVLFLKDIRNNPKKYGYESVTKEYNNESDLTIREMVNEYSEAFGVSPEVALAISCGESGWYKQAIATKKNNPFSYRLRSGKFASFDTLERGIMEGILNLRINYYEYGLTTIDSIQKKYCSENGNGWLRLIKGADKELQNGKKLYDEENLSLVYKGE